MRNTEVTMQGVCNQLIDGYIKDNHCLELLRFLCSYPYARFTR